MTTIEANIEPRIFGAKPRRHEPRDANNGSITDALRRVDAAMSEAPNHEPEKTDTQPQQPDPAPTIPAMAQERALQLVTNISTGMLGELLSLREQIDDLMRECNERRDQICEAVRQHAEFVSASIEAKVIISDGIRKLRDDFDRSRTPLPPTRNI